MEINWPGENVILKLWETLAEKGMGRLLSPGQAKRDAKAHREIRRLELLMLAQAEKDAEDIRAGRKQLLHNESLVMVALPNQVEEQESSNYRVEPKLNLSQLAEIGTQNAKLEFARTEINASKAIIFAEQALENDPQELSSEKIDDDWLHTWYEFAGKVSSEELQQLWGKILAGEIKSPGACSLRTLSFLRGLSRAEAEKIAKIAPFVLDYFILTRENNYLEAKGIKFSDVVELQEIGIISPGSFLSIKLNTLLPNEYVNVIKTSSRKGLILRDDNVGRQVNESCYLLTGIGKEILRLGSFVVDVDYLELLGKSFARDGLNVVMGNYVVNPDQTLTFMDGVEISAPEQQ